MGTRDVIQQYYGSLDQKNDTWQTLHADDAVFADAAHVLNAQGRTAIIQSFTPFLHGVTGVRLKHLIVDGEEACAIVGYEYVNPKGQTMRQDVAEVFVVKDGKIAQLTIYFDLTAYRSFMRQ